MLQKKLVIMKSPCSLYAPSCFLRILNILMTVHRPLIGLNEQKTIFAFILVCQLSHPYLEILNDSLLQNIFSKNHFSTKYFLMLDWELNVESFFLSTNGDYSRIIFRKETLKNSTNRKKESYQEFLEFNMVNFSLFFQKFLQSLIHLQKIIWIFF